MKKRLWTMVLAVLFTMSLAACGAAKPEENKGGMNEKGTMNEMKQDEKMMDNKGMTDDMKQDEKMMDQSTMMDKK